jgi:putative FmdB family regulatory protein
VPTYEYVCRGCDVEFERVVPMAERGDQACPKCECKDCVDRLPAMPAVMNVAMADGTRRFDNIRRYRALEKAKKAETDKRHQEKLTREMNRITGKETA